MTDTMNTERKKRYDARITQKIAPGTPNRKVIYEQVIGKKVYYEHATRGFKKIPNVRPDFNDQLAVIAKAQNFKRHKQ